MLDNNSPLMQMLTTQMRYTTQRQGVLAQNIANADTPGYQARDLKAPDFSQELAKHTGPAPVALARTSGKHFSGNVPSPFRLHTDPAPGEISPTGNSVSLEDQMAKISEIGTEYQVASSLMKKFTGMYRAALGNR